MTPPGPGAAATAVLLLHASFVLFVVGGLALVLLGGWRGWRWVRNPWFRSLHLLAIAVVVAETWLGLVCPLTELERRLRQRAGEEPHAGDFIAHWVERALYIDAPDWFFVVLHTGFGLLVLGSWLWVRPRPFRQAP